MNQEEHTSMARILITRAGQESQDGGNERCEMGTVTRTIEVGDPQGRNFRSIEVEAGTGSTHTALPREMLQALEVPVDRSVQSRLADGALQEVEIGQTTIRLGRRQFSTTVIFAEEGEPTLLGVIALEDALLAVDPVSNELIPVVAKRYLTG